MKKTIFILLASLLLCGTAMAQDYVRIDTVLRPYFEFDYEEWMSDPYHPLFIDAMPVKVTGYDSTLLSLGLPTGIREWDFNGDFVQYNYIEEGADVYGIAVWARGEGLNFTDSALLFPMEYLYLYEATPDTFQQLAMMDFINTNPFETEIWPEMGNRNATCDELMDDGASLPDRPPLHHWDFYFDKPIHVEDSFYVGASQAGYSYYQEMTLHPELYQGDLPDRYGTWYGNMWIHCLEANGETYCPSIYYDTSCWTPKRKQKLRMRKPDSQIMNYDRVAGLINHEWVNYDVRDFWMVVPIIKAYDTVWAVDTPACAAVESFNIMSRFGDTIILRWNGDGTHDEWQVSYGPEGTAPDDGTMEFCHNNRWRYIDTLHDGRPMVAYVRTVCRELDTLRFSPWSWGLTWRGTTQDIVLPPNRGWLAGSVRLMPNPASDQVLVMSDHRMLGIEVYQSDGRQYATLEAEGYSSSLSVKDWPKGIYVLRIHTTAGTVMQKLSVE